ncbi:pimeloyl-ACP methyl ester carboxylesterase [Lysobacter sp. HA35]
MCAKRYPQDLRAQLATLKQRLANAPVDVEYRDPATGEAKHDKLTAQTVVGLTQLFSYVPQAAALLPVVVDDAVQGRYGPLMALASLGGESMSGSMNRGMQWSVICAEDADRYVEDPNDANTALGTDMAKTFFAACRTWPHGTRPADFTKPLTGNVPVLLMSGELDPVTPPEYAERVAKTLPNSKTVVLKGQGHGQMGTGCMPKLIGKLIETANAKALDTKCLETVAPVPPFTSFNGWEP